MAYVKIEPTGCCVRKGKVQVRFSFYLEPSDARYNEHHIQLSGKWQNNPFHNHFIYVEPDATDEEIMGIGEAFARESYVKWAKNETPNPKNKPVKFLEFVSNKRRKACEAKVKHLKAMERKPEWL